jgi:hypothetical protein
MQNTQEWKEYKSISTETKNSKMSFFKLETAIANVPVTQFIISSLYRALNLNKSQGLDVWPNGVELFKSINDTSNQIPTHLTNHQFHELLLGALNIPKGRSKIEDQYLISPLIPEISSFGGAMRKGNSWNSGGYILQIIANAATDDVVFEEIIERLYFALSASEVKVGGTWIDFLKSEFLSIGVKLNIDCSSNKFTDVKADLVRTYRSNKVKRIYCESDFSKSVIRDLRNICLIGSSNKVTRQQWIGLLESYFRLLVFNHSINTLNQSRALFTILIEILDSNGHKEMTDSYFRKFINFDFTKESRVNKYLDISSKADKFINDNIVMYCQYNHFMDYLFESYSVKILSEMSKDDFISEINKLITSIGDKTVLLEEFSKYKIDFEELRNFISVKTDRQLAQISECLIYISQKKIIPRDIKAYIPDVNYLFSRRSGIQGNPYMFDLGSGTISLLTALIFKRNSEISFLSGIEFISALQEYNINLTIVDISAGPVKEVLQSLGIVIDSPDTEGGVLIVKPGWI